MKTLFLLTISFTAIGQISIKIETDTVIRTSDFYAWSYNIESSEYGVGTYWKLDYDYNLYHGVTSHHPPTNNKMLVGTWQQLDDSIVLNITKPKTLREKQPFKLKYGICQLKWTTDTGKSKHGEISIVTSYCILLKDKRLNFDSLKQALLQYLEKNETTTDMDIVNHFDTEDMVRNFFKSQKIIFGIKQYRNNNLSIR